MKTLLVALTCLVVSGCASDIGSRRMIEVGESCAALGRQVQVSGWELPEPSYFWHSYEPADLQVTCR